MVRKELQTYCASYLITILLSSWACPSIPALHLGSFLVIRETELLLLLLLTAIMLSLGGSGYFTCTQIWEKK
jgi:hypothetical protein